MVSRSRELRMNAETYRFVSAGGDADRSVDLRPRVIVSIGGPLSSHYLHMVADSWARALDWRGARARIVVVLEGDDAQTIGRSRDCKEDKPPRMVFGEIGMG